MQYVAPQETYNLLSSTTFAVFSILSTIICGLGVVSNYIFPLQRKFPNIVLVWTGIMDLILSLYNVIKWTNGPIKNAINANIEAGSIACKVSIYTILVLEMGSAITCLIVAFTLHATVVKNMDFEHFGTLYYKKFLFAIWGVSFLVPLLSLFDAFVPNEGSKVCSLTSTFGFIIFLLPWLILFLIQLRYILHVIFYIIKITWHVRSLGNPSSSAYTRAQLWLYTRFFMMLLSQCILWLNVNIWNMKNMRRTPITKAHLTLINKEIGLIPFFLSVNGLVVLLGNKSLMEFIWKQSSLLSAKWKIYSRKKNRAIESSIALSESQDSPL